MALVVSDRIWDAYYTPQRYTVYGNSDPALRFGTDIAVGRWAQVPGTSPLMLVGGRNGIPLCARSTSLTPAAAYWAENTFTPDHYSECAHNPPRSGTFAPNIGPAVRMSPDSDSCYTLVLTYTGGTNHAVATYRVCRINAGVETVLAEFVQPAWTYIQDFWFLHLQVWGENPVRLRAVSKAPTAYVAGSGGWDAGYTNNELPASQQFIYPEGHVPVPFSAGVTYNIDQGNEGWTYPWEEFGWWNTEIVPVANSFITPLGDPNWTKANPSRAWVLWEGTDSSPSRLLTGQPGLRDFGFGGFGANFFTAGDLDDRLTARIADQNGSMVVLGGCRRLNSTASVSYVSAPWSVIGTPTVPVSVPAATASSSAGGIALVSAAVSDPPTITAITPSTVAVGGSFTISLVTPAVTLAAPAATATASAGGIGAGATQSEAPTITGISPATVTVGQTFTLSLSAQSSAPTITGISPATVTIGESFTISLAA